MGGLPSQGQWKEKVQMSRSCRLGMLTAFRILLVSDSQERCEWQKTLVENLNSNLLPVLEWCAISSDLFLHGLEVDVSELREGERERKRERQTKMSRRALRNVCLPFEKRHEGKKQWGGPKCILQIWQQKGKTHLFKSMNTFE